MIRLATLATGVFPARHGLVANSWHQRSGFDWPLMYAVGDSTTRAVVAAIVLVIAADGLFGIAYFYLGF